MDISKLAGSCLALQQVTTERSLHSCLNDFTTLCEGKHFVLISCIAGYWHFDHNLPGSWVEAYQAANLLAVDPLLAYAFKLGQFATWQQVRSARCGEASVLALAKLEDGIVAPYKALTGEWAILILGHTSVLSLDTRFRLNVMVNAVLPTLLERASALHSSQTKALPALTKRERHCLLLAARGLTTAEIGQQLNITERTVLFHMSNASTKLGARNRQHAVAKALLKNLIVLTPNLNRLKQAS